MRMDAGEMLLRVARLADGREGDGDAGKTAVAESGSEA